MTPTTEASPELLRDIFPADVTLPDGQLHRAVRVCVSATRLYVFGVVDGQPTSVMDLPYTEADIASVYAAYNAPSTVTTALGAVVVRRAWGCGCGSPLKAWQPFTPMRLGPQT